MKILFAFFLVILGGAFLLPLFSDAAGLVPCGGCNADLDPVSGVCPLGQEQSACNICHTFVLINRIITFLLVPSAINSLVAIVPIAAAVLLALGGFFIFSSAGNTGRLEQGKKIITATVIGLLIIYGSWVFINLLLTSLGVAGWTGLGTWWQIECGSIPLLTFTAKSPTVFLGDSITLLWEPLGVSTCEASGGWSGPKQSSCSPTCSETISPTALGDYSYTLACIGLGGSSAGTVNVKVVPYIFTNATDFKKGTIINVNSDAPSNEQLQLNPATTPLSFIWVAASARGTIVKIDTVTGAILGEYRSAPDTMGRNPSRTTVDNNGNVWAGNRDEASGGQGSVVQIGLQENGQCQDRNGNFTIDTSTGLNDIKPWTNTGGADTNGGVSTAEDECVIKYVRVEADNTRHVSVDANNNVWTSGYIDTAFNLVQGSTGAILATFNVGCGGYGGLVDANGVIWSSQYPVKLLRYDTNGTPTDMTDDIALCIVAENSYGLGIDSFGNVWNANWENSTVRKFDPAGTLLGEFPAGKDGASGPSAIAGGARGAVAVDLDNNVWVVNSLTDSITRLKNDGSFVATVLVGFHPTGVAVDKNGFMWVTNLISDNVSQIDPATNTVVKTVSLGAGAGPYNYSDMTGSTLTGAPPQGTWTVVQDSGAVGAKWSTVTWTATKPSDSLLTVSVAVSDDGVTYSPSQQVFSGVQFNLTGRYLKVIAFFQRATTGETPVLLDLQIQRIP